MNCHGNVTFLTTTNSIFFVNFSVHLVPDTAIVDQVHQRTFQDMRQVMIRKHHSKITTRTFGDDPNNALVDDGAEISIGCGFSSDTTTTNNNKENENDSNSQQLTQQQQQPKRRRLQHVENAGACNNRTNFYCWMSCLDVPQPKQTQGFLNEGYSLYCVDPSVLASSGNRVSQAVKPCTEAGIVGAAMNSNCMGSWQPTAPGVPTPPIVRLDNNTSTAGLDEQPFCYGGTSMYMDGFQWSGTTCPIYLFPSLILSTRQALVLACLFTVLFGMALEWVIQCRRVTVQRFGPGYQRLCVSASFYALQLTMGYSIMLIVMIYSIPLFLSVVAGIVAGHVLFSAQDALMVVPSSLCCDSTTTINNATTNAATRAGGATSGAAGGVGPSYKDDTNSIGLEDASNLPSFTTTAETTSTTQSSNSTNLPYYHDGDTDANDSDDQKRVARSYRTSYGATLGDPTTKGAAGVPEGSTPCCQHTV